jgi:glucosylglycerate phosphorylase
VNQAEKTSQLSESWHQAITNHLRFIYGKKIAAQYSSQFQQLLNEYPVIPKARNVSQKDCVLIAYGDHVMSRSQTPLQTLHSFCSTYLFDCVNTIHILPHYPYTSDDGFSVSDYLSVKPELGSWKDIKKMQSDFYLMFDAVVNHTSISHPWFQAFLANDPKYQSYYIALDPKTDTSSVVRPRTTPLLTAFDTNSYQKHVWTTFSADQADLNYANPDVLIEVMRVLFFYVQQGADLLRLDAIAYIWSEVGTPSIHHAKTHEIVKLMHTLLDYAAPWVWLVTETNVPHDENLSYFGNGHNEAHMIYNFALPPLLVHTLLVGDATILSRWAHELRTPSDDTHFFNFTASHDGIGIRGVTNILSDNAIEAMCESVVERGGKLSMKTNTDGTTSVYEMNISYFNAIIRPGSSLDSQVDQFISSQSIMLSLKGIPGIYLHSLLGSNNWYDGVKETGQNRSINREKLDYNILEQELNDSSHMRFKVFSRYKELLRIRSDEPHFDPLANQVIRYIDKRIFAIIRCNRKYSGFILALHNVSNEVITITLQQHAVDLLTRKRYKNTITLLPYQISWLKIETGDYNEQ